MPRSGLPDEANIGVGQIIVVGIGADEEPYE